MTTATTSAVLYPRDEPEVHTDPGVPSGVTRARWALTDTLTITKRNLIAYTRIPEALFFSTLQPVMFVLLFRYVFGGAIRTGYTISYIDFLMAGVMVQSVAFGGIGAAVGLADDLQKGLLERFRALPMARSAVLAGRTFADLIRNVFVTALMTGIGAAVGFDFPNGWLGFVAGAALVVLFSYALLWGFVVVGLVAPNSETAQIIAFPVLFPLIFASSAFVNPAFMPHWMRSFAGYQPVGAVINAARDLMVGGNVVGGDTTGHVVAAVAWCVGLLAVLVPLAVWRYRRSA